MAKTYSCTGENCPIHDGGAVRCTATDCEYRTPHRKLTNADRIRAMSDEELAVWHEQYCPNRDDIDKECQKESCELCWLDWLKQEVEG